MSTNPLLIAIELIAASIWTGGMVCITLVFQVARGVLDESAQARFFRSVGRRYGIVGTSSLLVAVAAGVALSWPLSSWSGATSSAFALAGVLIVTTAVGVKQARFMSKLRRSMIGGAPSAVTIEAMRRGRLLATYLRSAMSLMTLIIILLASFAVAH
ncbi:MAG: hypothetical protein ACRDVC_10090 [Acidimicrobiales bacterium]